MFDLAVFLLFWLMMACNLIVAFVYGRRIERAFAVMLVLLSVLVPVTRIVFGLAEWGGPLIRMSDAVILIAAWGLALRSDRYWPLWFAAMQTLAVLTELLSWARLDTQYIVFANLAAFWSLPALLAMTWGTILDRKHSRRNEARPRVRLA